MQIRRARSLRAFARHAGGVAALEFAFIAPMLIFFYFGVAETCQLLMAQRRVSHAATALADLVTQDTDMGATEIRETYEAVCAVMRPFPPSRVSIRVSSISRRADDTIKVDWSDDNGGNLGALTADTLATTATPVPTVGDSVVVAEVQYEVVSNIGYFLPGVTELNHKSEMRPRKSQRVTGLSGTLTPPTGVVCS